MIVTINQLDKYYGGNCILKGVDAVVHEGQKIGLVGANGEGKTTLLNIIAKELDYDAGSISAEESRIGYLKQNSAFAQNGTIMGEMMAIFAPLLRIKDEMEELRKAIEKAEPSGTDYLQFTEEYSQKNAYFEQHDGYNMEVKANTILNGMGFLDYNRDGEVEVLSGGEKTRLALARLLLRQPDLLILDEPTNHLDFRTLTWLEEYLASYKGAILVVSHDRYFLDKLVGEVWEVENHKLSAYTGNYSAYVRQKRERIERQTKEYEMQQQEIFSMEDYVARNMARASTSKSARSRVAALERMVRIEKPIHWDKRPNFSFCCNRQPVKDVLHIEGLSLAVGEDAERKELCQNINLDLFRGEKIAFIGANGVGKSSLLRAIQGQIPCQSKRLQWGRNVDISYFEQENRQLCKEKQAINQIWDLFPKMYEQEVRSMLGRAMLRGEDVFKLVGSLSGGERARLAFCLIMLERANVLILDEPTNHLDIGTKEQLEDALVDYDGTLILVSHDRYLLTKIPTSIVEMTPQGLKIYKGNYNAYLAAQKEEKSAPPPAKEKPASEPANKYYRSKKDRARQVALKNRLAQLEDGIEETEAEIAENEALMATPEVAGDYLRLQEICSLLEEKRALLEELTEEWMELGEEAQNTQMQE